MIEGGIGSVNLAAFLDLIFLYVKLKISAGVNLEVDFIGEGG